MTFAKRLNTSKVICRRVFETKSHIISHARKKQRSLIIMILYLKNTFGKVSHDLLLSVLKYHHIPDHIINLVKSLYTHYQITVTTDSYVTSPITVRLGVWQGDSFSPLLFNLIINLLINTIKQDKMNWMGYVYDDTLAPKHCMQSANDTALVTSLESGNQYLCDAFVKWSTWAGLIIKIIKCHVLGIKQVKTDIIQYKPYMTINKKTNSSCRNIGELYLFR